MRRSGLRLENAAQAMLLRLLRDSGPRSRAELAEAVHLSKSKLAVELDRLAELELIELGGLAASRGGRRAAIVQLSSRLRFLGVDIGATSVDVAVTDGELRVLARVSEPVEVRRGPDVVLETVLDLVGKLRSEGHALELNGAAIGVPGPVSFRDGIVKSPPIMPGWDGFPLREAMSQELSCPVLVDNDVNIMALGERASGIARSVDDFLFLKIGTGIGCGIVLNGEVYRGVSGSAGDIGHISVDDDGPVCSCGNVGCLEAFFGGAALARDAVAAARSGRSSWLADRYLAVGALTAVDVGAAAAAGDTVALAMIRDGGRRVGNVLAGLVNFVNPGLIVIGGGVAGLGHILLAELRGVVYRRSLPLATGNLPIVLSELGSSAGIVGAARLMSDHVFTASATGSGA